MQKAVIGWNSISNQLQVINISPTNDPISITTIYTTQQTATSEEINEFYEVDDAIDALQILQRMIIVGGINGHIELNQE